jgi:hypothetical protein
MSMNGSAVRRYLFAALDSALQGESVEIVYKGATLRLTSAGFTSKLARAKRRSTIIGDPGSIVQTEPGLMKEMEAGWERDWNEL